jgi:hypothetical protein
LEGAPETLEGNFDCSKCVELETLKGAPKEVSKNFNCSGCNNLKTLEGAPEKVGDNFNCAQCDNLESLEGAPKYIGKDFVCKGNKKLKIIKQCPEKIEGTCYFKNCVNLQIVDTLPKEVKDIEFENCPYITIKELPENFKHIYFKRNPVKKLGSKVLMKLIKNPKIKSKLVYRDVSIKNIIENYEKKVKMLSKYGGKNIDKYADRIELVNKIFFI